MNQPEIKKFLLVYTQKEGSTAILQTLDNLPNITVVKSRRSYEPFDLHENKELSPIEILSNFNYVFRVGTNEELTAINENRKENPEYQFDINAPVRGCKMRIRVRKDFNSNQEFDDYINELFSILTSNNFLVFILHRENIFNWALSTYHGDGSGHQGHLQFKLARGVLSQDSIPKIRIDSQKFLFVYKSLLALVENKRRLYRKLENLNMGVVILIYEDFLANKRLFFKKIYAALNVEVSESQLSEGLKLPIILKKVHSKPMSDYFVNYDEIKGLVKRKIVPFN